MIDSSEAVMAEDGHLDLFKCGLVAWFPARKALVTVFICEFIEDTCVLYYAQ